MAEIYQLLLLLFFVLFLLLLLVVIIAVNVVHVIVVDPRSLNLMFGQNQVSNSWDIADMEFLVVVEKPQLMLWEATAYVVVV